MCAPPVIFEQNTPAIFTVFHNLETPPHGRHLERWPLHMTLVAPIQAPIQKLNDIVAITQDLATASAPMTMAKQSLALFGPENNVPVSTYKESRDPGRLQALHTSLFESLSDIDNVSIDPTYALERYAPHVTSVDGIRSPEMFSLHSLSVMVRTRDIRCLISTHLMRRD